jgi:Plasmid stabilisation system protein.
MKRLRPTWQDRALQQYEHQIAWIAAESIQNAERMEQRVRASLSLLQTNPRFAPVSLRRTGTRQLRVARLLFFYKIHDDRIEIVSVKHGAQNI